MRRGKVTVLFGVGFFLWNVGAFLLLTGRHNNKQNEISSHVEDAKHLEAELEQELQKLLADIEAQEQEQKQAMGTYLDLLQKLKKDKDKNQVPQQEEPEKPAADELVGEKNGRAVSLTEVTDAVIPVLVIACNRVTITRNLDQLIKYRPSPKRFPIIVSQDCGHEATANAILKYKDQDVHLIQHPDLSDINIPKNHKKWQGYYKISRHYKWALNQVFHTFQYTVAIIVEDDLDIAPDFFEYFMAMYPVLLTDPTIMCVSAWNDNGKADQIMQDPELLYRTDFFPGLGWMLTLSLWEELEPKWPASFWDDWIRQPDQRKSRACIRPEISRTSTFGKNGVSKGQFFDKYLKFIQLNSQFVPFTTRNLTYLLRDNYDAQFVQTVYNAPLLSHSQVMTYQKPEYSVVRLQYNTPSEFKRMAKELGIMNDFKSGVPRTAYRGVVPLTHSGRRVFLAPPANWSSYDPNAS